MKKEDIDSLLTTICKDVNKAVITVESRKKEKSEFLEYLVFRKDKVKVKIHKEPGGQHHRPHMHIEHSDRFSASVSIDSFEVIAGSIPRDELKLLKSFLQPKQNGLKNIWNELNEKDNSVEVQVLIDNLGLPKR